ncbi:MAG: HD domain-containing protein [Isosphaeraceae bacterium]
MFDKYRKRQHAPRASDRIRHQVALEAARRLFESFQLDESDPFDRLERANESDYYTAKRKAAAVLGHRIRPGDLPSDGEVRDALVVLVRSRSGLASLASGSGPPEPDEGEPLAQIADHLDRFAIYRMRLAPLESVKQNPKYHPEGDALYHSLQVFELARRARPYDEEFLLAALLHDVGKALEPTDHVAASVEALRGAVPERTLWLVEHHMDLLGSRDRSARPRARLAIEDSEYLDDLKLLRELDDAGRVPGAIVGTVDEALAYLKGLEDESYLDRD